MKETPIYADTRQFRNNWSTKCELEFINCVGTRALSLLKGAVNRPTRPNRLNALQGLKYAYSRRINWGKIDEGAVLDHLLKAIETEGNYEHRNSILLPVWPLHHR